MFRREHHIGGAVKRVRSRGEDTDFVAATGAVAAVADRGTGVIDPGYSKIDFRAFASSDPIFLEQFDPFWPIEPFELIQQALGICHDSQHPLPHWPADDRKSANLALAIDHFFIGEHSAQFGAPIHWHIGHISQPYAIGISAAICRNRFRSLRLRVEPGVVDLKENPLRPPVKMRVAGVDFALPVVGEPDAFQLAFKFRYVLTRCNRRMLAGFDCILLGRQTECIPAHRMQHVEAVHSLVARNDVSGGVTFGMTDMQASSARIGKHVQDIELLFARIEIRFSWIRRVKDLALFPNALPLGFKEIERIGFASLAHPRTIRNTGIQERN